MKRVGAAPYGFFAAAGDGGVNPLHGFWWGASLRFHPFEMISPIGVAIASSFFGGLAAVRALNDRSAHRIALGAATVAFVAAAWAGVDALFGASLATLSRQRWPLLLAAFFAALSLAMVAGLPRGSRTRPELAAILVTEAAVLGTYAADDLVMLALAFLVSGLPAALLLRRSEATSPIVGLALVGSGGLLLAAAVLVALSAVEAGIPAPWSLSALKGGSSAPGAFAFSILMVAVSLRQGLVPFHLWLPRAFEREHASLAVLVFNANLGAFVVARLGIPLFPAAAVETVPWLSNLALLTALVASVAAVTQTSLRRLVAHLSLSHAAFIVAGLEHLDGAGLGGALLHWMAVGGTTTAAMLLLGAVEGGRDARWRRWGTLLTIGALALATLPGPLGLASEDTLLRGIGASHPSVGVLVLVVSGLNAVHVLRVFVHLFFERASAMPSLREFRPREAIVLVVLLAVLLVAAVWPRRVVAEPTRPQRGDVMQRSSR